MKQISSKAWFALAVLFAINTLNFYDRQILGAVGETVREEWKLSDTASDRSVRHSLCFTPSSEFQSEG
jgi:hypothetical protein